MDIGIEATTDHVLGSVDFEARWKGKRTATDWAAFVSGWGGIQRVGDRLVPDYGATTGLRVRW